VKHEIDCYFEPDITWLGEINRQVLRLERELSVFPSRQTRLNCALRPCGDSPAGVTLTLDIGDKQLRSFGEDPSPVKATRTAFDKLRQSLCEHVSERRREEFWGRTSLNQGADVLASPQPQSRRQAASLIDLHLESLYNFARREVAYRQAIGDLAVGDLAPEEVVDEVALLALEQFEERPTELDFDHWLMQLALDVIERRVKEFKEEREGALHLEEDVPETPPQKEVAHAGDELFEFFQPDEDLRLEDLIEDKRVPTPEEVLERRDLQHYVESALAQLPRRWHEAFVLYSVEGLTLEETARVMRRPVEDVRNWVELTRALLRARLVDEGVVQDESETASEEVRAL
jgi:RNA polymerase sigma factor (sigma-70 family)